MAQGSNCPPRRAAYWIPGLWNDGTGTRVGLEITGVQGFGMGAATETCGRGSHLPWSGPTGAVPQSDRYCSVSAAFDARHGGDFLRQNFRDDAQRRHADKCWTWQARRREGSHKRPRFRAIVVCGARRPMARATAQAQSALAAPEGDHHAACGTAPDRSAACDADCRKYPKFGVRRLALATN